MGGVAMLLLDGRWPPNRYACELRQAPTIKVQDIEPATVIVFLNCAVRHEGRGTGGRM